MDWTRRTCAIAICAPFTYRTSVKRERGYWLKRCTTQTPADPQHARALMATVMLVHGMFLNPRSWQLWKEFFERRGYDCIAPAWPMHEGDPGDLRSHVPPGFSSLCLNDVVQRMEEVASDHEDLILVGHSVGGLVVQK